MSWIRCGKSCPAIFGTPKRRPLSFLPHWLSRSNQSMQGWAAAFVSFCSSNWPPSGKLMTREPLGWVPAQRSLCCLTGEGIMSDVVRAPRPPRDTKPHITQSGWLQILQEFASLGKKKKLPRWPPRPADLPMHCYSAVPPHHHIILIKLW